MSGIIFNEDCNHFFFTRGPEKMTRAGLIELVDRAADPEVREFVFNVNAMRTGYAGKVFQPFWDGLDPAKGPDQPLLANGPYREQSEWIFRSLMNARLLHERGIDPYAVWVARARELGRAAWISMRMNDVHFVDHPDGWTCCDFWKKHPEFWRTSHRFENWMDRAFDYIHPEVRDYHMALVREILARYDCDGLELDWMRFGYHFRPGFEEEGRKLLIDFHRTVRELADARARQLGHPVKIGVRVPPRPESARGLGLDAVAWARLGLVDTIVLTPWDSMDFDVPVEEWKELLSGTNVMISTTIDVNVRPHPRVGEYANTALVTSPELARGLAASFFHRGADQMYVFNFQDTDPPSAQWENYRQGLGCVGTLELATVGPRRHVVTFNDTPAPGETPAHALPATFRAGWTAAFRVHIGPRPTSGQAYVLVGLGKDGALDINDLETRVNGTLCPANPHRLFEPVHPVVQAQAGFAIPLETLHNGYNLVEITGRGDRDRQIVWVEIEIVPA